MFGESFSGILRFETARTARSFEINLPIDPDHIQPVGPGGIGVANLVVDAVDQAGDRNLQLAAHRFRDVDTGIQSFRLLENDALAFVAATLPTVGGMRFADINQINGCVVFVFLLNLFQVADPVSEGGSCVAAEDQQHRFFPLETGKLDGFFSVDRFQREIGSDIAHFQFIDRSSPSSAFACAFAELSAALTFDAFLLSLILCFRCWGCENQQRQNGHGCEYKPLHIDGSLCES